MYFKTLTVWISFRMNAGHEKPSWKALRAQIYQNGILGTDIVRQGIFDPQQVIRESLNWIANNVGAKEVRFEFSEQVKRYTGQLNRTYSIKDGIVTETKGQSIDSTYRDYERLIQNENRRE